MGDNSKIEWTDATWNPIRARNNETGRVGWFCEHTSPGCAHCYAEAMNRWRGNGVEFRHQNRELVTLFLDLTILTAPLLWKRPRKIFLGSMTDLFGPFVPDAMINEILAIAVLARRHTFQILTKRSSRQRDYFSRGVTAGLLNAIERLDPNPDHEPVRRLTWPLPNVWAGVSVEDQENTPRIADLVRTPAAIRFVSFEPMLGPIDARQYLIGHEEHGIDMDRDVGSRAGACIGWTPPIDWVIAGGESGPGARPAHPEWFRSLRNQCAKAGTSFFFKQWGDWREFDHGSADYEVDVGSELADACLAGIRPGWVTRAGDFFMKSSELPIGVPCRLMERVGKKLAGAMLDGREHREFPA